MKRTLSMIAFVALTVGLLGSCSKINERLDNLEKDVNGLKNEKIASIESQIASITSSIADLGTIRSDISSLKQSASDHSVDIFNLEEADRALKDRIDNLEDYLDVTLPKFAEKEWVEATFSTLEQYDSTCTAIAEINVKIGELDARTARDIQACADSMKTWVNEQLDAYYTAAEMDAKLAQMKSAIDSSKASGKITDAKADSIARELAKTKTAVDSAKANIRKEYKAAIKSAIDSSEARLTKKIQNKIDKVNKNVEELAGRVSVLDAAVAALTVRVEALEGMIQSVVIVPAYSDGSVEVDYEKDSLYIDCIVSPSKVVANLEAGDVAVLVNKVKKTKSNSGVDTIKIIGGNVFEKDDTKGTVSVRVSVADKIPATVDSTITVAVNIKNGNSNFTTEFVPILLPVSVSLDIHSICVPFSTSIRDTTLKATVNNSSKGVTWTSSNTDIATVDKGEVTINANAVGKDTIVVTTDEGAKTDTCFITVLPKEALAGEFTVNASGKKVHFSQGNLFWNGSAFKFEDNQSGFSSSWNASHVSHFFWNETASKAYAASYTGGTPGSWDVFFTNANDFKIDGQAGWRTLSNSEWQYLFDNHPKKWVTVNGVKGYVIAPDGFEGTLSDTYANDTALAADKLVFLPAASSRDGSAILSGSNGYYWSISLGAFSAPYRVEFSTNGFLYRNVKCDMGSCIRLIKDCQ